MCSRAQEIAALEQSLGRLKLLRPILATAKPPKMLLTPLTEEEEEVVRDALSSGKPRGEILTSSAFKSALL